MSLTLMLSFPCFVSLNVFVLPPAFAKPKIQDLYGPSPTSLSGEIVCVLPCSLVGFVTQKNISYVGGFYINP